jgi:hypothetical protein
MFIIIIEVVQTENCVYIIGKISDSLAYGVTWNVDSYSAGQEVSYHSILLWAIHYIILFPNLRLTVPNTLLQDIQQKLSSLTSCATGAANLILLDLITLILSEEYKL